MSSIVSNVFNQLLKPSCVHCKFFNKALVASTTGTGTEISLQSTCGKFLVSPLQHTYYEKSGMATHDFREKHPYAVMARLDITMCGLNGAFFHMKT